jgi:hypothetical protein
LRSLWMRSMALAESAARQPDRPGPLPLRRWRQGRATNGTTTAIKSTGASTGNACQSALFPSGRRSPWPMQRTTATSSPMQRPPSDEPPRQFPPQREGRESQAAGFCRTRRPVVSSHQRAGRSSTTALQQRRAASGNPLGSSGPAMAEPMRATPRSAPAFAPDLLSCAL